MRIKELYVYPIKSLRGSSLPSLSATYHGFAHDRCFMLLDAGKMKNMHVSDYTEMCLFTTDIVFPTQSEEYLSNELKGKIVVTFNPPNPNPFSPAHTSRSTLDIPLQPSTSDLAEVKIVMHSSPTTGYDMGTLYNDWFSERFGYRVILVYLGQNRRPVLGNMPPNVALLQQSQAKKGYISGGSNANHGKSWFSSITSVLPSIPLFGAESGGAEVENEDYPGVDEGITFADCAPFLVISTKSWEDAQARLSSEPGKSSTDDVLDISKFRPNIIVDGAETAFEEDYWAQLEILPQSSAKVKAKLVLTQNCARCNSLNVDYATGKVGTGESGKVLKKLQRDRRVDPGSKYSPIFGRYGFLDRIRCSDEGGNGDGTGDKENVGSSVMGNLQNSSGGKKNDLVTLKVGDEVLVSKRNAERTTIDWPESTS